ncbi:MAG TPA: DUF4153 domain-containing protein, partial [Euzebyales bacterium]|nr:DUF4153 domain-containing protein [Euzebyales bacterium]
WVLPFAAAAGLALLAVLNVVNGEAQVARANLVAGGPAGSPDVAYLARDLSADAVPALLAHAGALDAGRRAALVTQICARHGAHGAPESPLAWNRSRSRAAAAVAAACAS